ncbi:MAG: C4-dicarboxylate ABC transporter permease [Clostridiaceae bacterium BRH_c20a]|nr:MAG: C4-dicarboxylate ABC transporter permease [Clostridiaceae bacterium BRH_c20a]
MLNFALFGSMFLLMIIKVPIAIALGLASIVGLTLMGDIPLIIVVQRMFTSNDSFPLLAVPYFMLAGELMTAGGVSKRLVRFAASLVGHFRGGLGGISILASAFFAALSGSNAATVAAIGAVMIPSMKEKGYPEGYTAATIAAAGVTGMIIPPSILMILYGVVAGISIGDLFIAGFGPGILICISMMFVNWFICRKQNFNVEKWHGGSEILSSFKDAIWALLMPVIILGGIYGGIFTPTEAAAIAALYGFIIGFFIYKELTLKKLPEIILKSALSTAVVMLVMNTAGLFGWVITANQLPQALAVKMSAVSGSHIVFLLLVNLMLIVVGCFMNAAAAIPIFASILLPAAANFGIDPLLFGIIMVVNLSIGTITPPLGVDLFVASTISKVSLEEIIGKIWPYIIIVIIDLMLITYYPPISMFLVRLLS